MLNIGCSFFLFCGNFDFSRLFSTEFEIFVYCESLPKNWVKHIRSKSKWVVCNVYLWFDCCRNCGLMHSQEAVSWAKFFQTHLSFMVKCHYVICPGASCQILPNSAKTSEIRFVIKKIGTSPDQNNQKNTCKDQILTKKKNNSNAKWNIPNRNRSNGNAEFSEFSETEKQELSN